jgi:hypothetical protein
VTNPQKMAAGMLAAAKNVAANPTSMTEPCNSRMYSCANVLTGPVAMLIGSTE